MSILAIPIFGRCGDTHFNLYEFFTHSSTTKCYFFI